MELKVLATVLASRDAWEEISTGLGDETRKFFTPEGNLIFDQIGEFYTLDPDARNVDRDLLVAAIRRNVSSEKRADRIQSVVDSLPREVSVTNVVRELKQLRKDGLGTLLVGALHQGAVDPTRIKELMSEYMALGEEVQGVPEKDSYVLQGVSVEELVANSFDQKNLIKLSPKVLNDHVGGGAKRGHHIVIFAPVEMGKTLAAMNLAVGFVEQMLRVLYIGNEDPAADIYMRYMTRMLKVGKEKIIANPARAQAELDKLHYGNLILAPMSPGTFRQIRGLIIKYKPDVVILDQLRNLDVQSDGRVQQLEKAATEARNLGKSMDVLVVSITQAADSATGKRVLSRGDIDSSNVGIPAQADLMLGIGATEDEERRNIRILSFPKNKLSGRHEPIPVTIDPETSRIIE